MTKRLTAGSACLAMSTLWRGGEGETNLQPLMPTILRLGRFHFFFFSNEGQEPAPIPIKAGDDEAKFWLERDGNKE